ncbi:MAG TPA: peptidylprolyl isomerase, partial [Chryseolinea sp.]|nr:peptidylprolyl isomerase [Chryseolinea sp.]
TESPNLFADTTYIRIGDLQDRRMSDSLIAYLDHSQPAYRQQALIALGSIQDSMTMEPVGELLADAEASVRHAAAFALGQTRCRASERLLRGAIDREVDPLVRAKLYESYGRATLRWDLWDIPTDTITAAGFAWGLFRTAGDSLLNPLAGKLLQSPSITVRLGAAHYFARKAPSPRSEADHLIAASIRDPNEEVRMAAVSALRKIPTDAAFEALQKVVLKDPSYRVRVNAVAALQTFPVTRARPLLLKSLKDHDLNVAVRAAEVITHLPVDSSWQQYAVSARNSRNFRVKALLYQAALQGSEDSKLYHEVRALYTRAPDPYHKAAYLAAMGETLMSFAFVCDELMRADTAVVRTAAALALISMNRNKNFIPALKNDFIKIYTAAIALGDLGVTSVVCDALSDPALDYKSVVKDWQFLIDAKNKLTVPADNETLQAVEGAIAFFEGKEITAVRNGFNHAIDWQAVRAVKADQIAVIATSKGIITIQLFVEEAPGSVANFVSLVQSGAYRDKFFHRVVPNFVAQGGCPRGDGFGSEDYSIRSEFSLRRYKTGSVGMASSGKDTESSQWFITHSPTPHLDGAYTIFAEVVYGMDIVHQLEVGDKILNIELPQ